MPANFAIKASCSSSVGAGVSPSAPFAFAQPAAEALNSHSDRSSISRGVKPITAPVP